jgi:flavin-dependent dehydrogenase
VTPTLDTPVLIAGGGPTGLALASVLARDGVNWLLAERNPEGPRAAPRAPATISVGRQRVISRHSSGDGLVRWKKRDGRTPQRAGVEPVGV